MYTYRVPESLRDRIAVGSRVIVPVVRTKYLGVVSDFLSEPDIDPAKVRYIHSIEPYPPIRMTELSLWRQMADYYMCSIGEVYAAACPSTLKPVKVKASESKVADGSSPDALQNEVSGATPEIRDIKPLSDSQSAALLEIKNAFGNRKAVLLNGVTGSGKTEIYIHLIKECLEGGGNALFMLPEKAVSRQLVARLKKVFGDSVMVFHSGVQPAKRKEIIKTLSIDSQSPKLVIGLRSSVFLPFDNLGLVIVDEEHDSSYKQYDPSPRYNGRDVALMLARIHSAQVVLGSATPSFESLYNVRTGRYVQVLLDRKFHDAAEPVVTVVDMKKKKRERAVTGSISFILRDAIRKRLDDGEQVLVFRSRRAYATAMVCDSCGDIPHCPHCNASLTYHKFSNTLRCHYCGYSFRLTPGLNCPSCREGTLSPVGAGTEKIEEELKGMFPGARVARFDSDTAEGKDGREILKSFAEGNIDILVGTQMVSKGFDFPGLTLAAVIQGESLIGINDFRADEKALQLLTQLRGRVGRRNVQGEMIIQTVMPDHPVFRLEDINALLDERKEFGFPPFTRMLEITVRNKSELRLRDETAQVEQALRRSGVSDYDGPVPGAMDRQQDEHIVKFTLRLEKNREMEMKKIKLMDNLSILEANITINVDPL